MNGRRLLPVAAAVIAGALMALQSRINGQLSTAIGNGVEAALISFGTGLIIVTTLMLVFPSIRRGLARIPAAIRDGEIAWWQVLGGILGAFLVAVQAATVPLVGVAIFTVAVVAGQSGNSLFVDRIGLGPAGRQAITPRRILSAGLAIVAVIVAVSHRLLDGHVAVVPVLFALVAGSGIAVQQAINGRVARATSSPMSATVLNFTFGTIGLASAFGVSIAVTTKDAAPLPGGPWWIYAGGFIGVLFIAAAAWVVPIIGVLLFALLSIAGQLTGAVILDIVAPTSGTELEWNLFAGVALAFVAVAIGSGRGRGSGASAVRESAA